MDEKTKLMLMKHTDSYWNLLPTEIKEVILNYKERQELIDWRESETSRALCRQIEMHKRLRSIWCGSIQCIPMCFEGIHIRNPEGCSFGPNCEHMRIYGHYYDSHFVRQRHYFGCSFQRAIDIVTPVNPLPSIIMQRRNEHML